MQFEINQDKTAEMVKKNYKSSYTGTRNYKPQMWVKKDFKIYTDSSV